MGCQLWTCGLKSNSVSWDAFHVSWATYKYSSGGKAHDELVLQEHSHLRADAADGAHDDSHAAVRKLHFCLC